MSGLICISKNNVKPYFSSSSPLHCFFCLPVSIIFINSVAIYLFWWMYCFLFFPNHVYHFSTVTELFRPWKGLRSSSTLKSKIRGVKLKSSCTDDIRPILIFFLYFTFMIFRYHYTDFVGKPFWLVNLQSFMTWQI